jgi:autotransporter-associated beta strand protein
MRRMGLGTLFCGIAVSMAIGMGWDVENAWGAAVTDSSFDWRTPNGSGSSFVSPIKNQGSTPECSFFARVGVAEAWYKITRGDSTNVWCGAAQSSSATSQTGLSEQTIVDLDYNYGINGTFPDMVNPNNPSDNCHGLLTRQDLNWHSSGSLDSPQPGWTIPAAYLNRRFFITSCTTAIPTPGSAQVKAMLLANGPFRIPVMSSYDFLGNFNNYSGPPPSSNHSVMVVGWRNLPASDPNYAAWGGGYFVVKNSWGTSPYDGGDYYGGAYGSYAGVGVGFYGVPYAVLDQRADYVSDMVTGPAYFNGSLSSAAWSNGSGNCVWNTSSQNWSHAGGTWGQGEIANGWLNGETAATFSGTATTTITIDASSHISAYGVTLTAGSNYTFAGGPLIITGYHNDPVVTGGGINAHASVTFSNSKITVGAPSTWTVDTGQTLTVNTPVDLNISTLTIDGSGTTNLNGAISDVVTNPTFSGLLAGYSGSLVKNGIGTLNLNNSGNTFRGSLTVNAGTLGLVDSNFLQNVALIWNGGNINWNGPAGQTLCLGSLAGTGTLNLASDVSVGSNNSSSVFAGVLAGTGALTKTGTGTLSLVGADNTYGGGTNIQGGLIKAWGVGSLGAGALSLDGGGGLAFGQSFDFNRPITINNAINGGGGTLDVSNAGGTVSGGISGPGGLTKTGGGALVLSGVNTYSGGTTVNAGALAVTALSALPDYGTPGKIVVNSGGALTVGNPAELATILSAATFYPGSFAGIDTTSGSLSYANPALPSGVGFAVSGANTLTLSGANTYSGGTMIVSGTLSVSSDGNLGAAPGSATPGKLVIGGGALMASNSFTLNTNRGIALGPGAGSAGAGTIIVASGKTLTYGGAITNNGSNTGSLIKTGAGTLTLTGTNTYSGDTYLNGGFIYASSLANLGSGSQLVFNGGGLQFGSSSFDASRRTMVFSGNATLDTRTGDNVWLTRSIGGGGSGSLVKTGAGRLSLYGDNTYTGGTTVASGTLSVRNTIGSATGSGPVTINAGTGLSGLGIIDGPLTIAGSLTPDSGSWSNSLPEVLTVNNQVTFLPGSTLAVMVNGLAAGETGYGQLLATGPVSLAGSLTLTFGNFTPTGHDILFLINNAGTGATTGAFQYADDAKIGTFNGFDWYISYDADNGVSPSFTGGNDVAICSFPVPEPATLALLVVALPGSLLLTWRKLRHRSRT